ncbi:MAG: hypothetical protein A2860_00205 [Candidatus Levybacteria bacterium RIFCSPHIGHO2_01_FULL_37_33]|nr:MAG: hypothetical protein A2860_00205 [Candidatus Levybacteria bacterium RIFCSPHIGHO2_01_FULL_37_33]OGH17590.1 MAG: hypothetical protein A3C97_01700 [Candidatus Levybacteria bacterium RIFCSPHIGHO2_02_FULL_37_11]OGH29038.1 MAG: hypothetical protein A3F30_03390 [Candidatus Levybacteria bacterium RIFCSPHIGHO2_12_FULL_37_12]OGH33152.1 MAG: hypothetical protein A2953_00420 [Candidatus Levybacteria bacterium RIFCSPLOWO2_01_FULL_36_54]
MSYKNSSSKSDHTHTHARAHTHTDSIFDIPIFAKLYEFYKNLSVYILSFPKIKRYTIGQKLDKTTLEIFKNIISAAYISGEQKLPAIEKAITNVNFLKILIRLAKDTKALDNKKYILLEQDLQEIGRMLGGWKKSVSKEGTF